MKDCNNFFEKILQNGNELLETVVIRIIALLNRFTPFNPSEDENVGSEFCLCISFSQLTAYKR